MCTRLTDAHADMVVDQLKKAFLAQYGSVEDDSVTNRSENNRQRLKSTQHRCGLRVDWSTNRNPLPDKHLRAPTVQNPRCHSASEPSLLHRNQVDPMMVQATDEGRVDRFS